jgi:hypothetical protein
VHRLVSCPLFELSDAGAFTFKIMQEIHLVVWLSKLISGISGNSADCVVCSGQISGSSRRTELERGRFCKLVQEL